MPSRSEDPPSSPSAAVQEEAPSLPKGGPTKAELKKYREALLVLRTEILKSSSKLADEALKGSGQDFSVDHMADHGTDNFEQDFSLSLLEGETELFRDIQRAIDKIDGREELPVRALRELRRRAAARRRPRALRRLPLDRQGAALGRPVRPALRRPAGARGGRPGVNADRPWRLKVLALTVLVVGLALDLGTKAWFADLLGMDSGVAGAVRRDRPDPRLLRPAGHLQPRRDLRAGARADRAHPAVHRRGHAGAARLAAHDAPREPHAPRRRWA